MSKQIRNIDLEEAQKQLKKFRDKGDQNAFASFYQSFTPLIYGVCMKYLKNEEDSKDAVMEIYQKLHRKLKTMEIEHLKSWLYTVVKNHCFEILRKKQRFIEKENEANYMYSEEVFHLNDTEGKNARIELLEDCIEKLNPEQKDCIKRFYLEKYTYKEISEELELSWSRIRSLIQNGRRNLKICMEKKYEAIRKR